MCTKCIFNCFNHFFPLRQDPNFYDPLLLHLVFFACSSCFLLSMLGHYVEHLVNKQIDHCSCLIFFFFIETTPFFFMTIYFLYSLLVLYLFLLHWVIMWSILLINRLIMISCLILFLFHWDKPLFFHDSLFLYVLCLYFSFFSVLGLMWNILLTD